MVVVCVDTASYCVNEMKRIATNSFPKAHIFTFTDTGSALAFLKSTPCDVLMTEIEMGFRGDLSAGDSFGLVLANIARNINRNVNVIFVTVCDESEFAKDVIDLRLSGYVTKPYDGDKLAYELSHLRNPVTA